jgi:hypothetical protein
MYSHFNYKHAIFILIAIIATSCNGQNNNSSPLPATSTVKVGPNILIPSQFKNLAIVEPHISVHPSDNDHLLVAAMVVTDNNRPYESCRLSSFVSGDGGVTWTETAHDWWGYDPWTAILPNGKTVMSWIGTVGNFQDKYPIVFFNSPDGGIHWNKEMQILEGSHDGTKITASNDGFYFTTLWFREDMNADVRLYKNEKNGNFQQANAVAGKKGQRLDFCEAAVLTDGTIVVPVTGKNSWVQVSMDGGKTLSEPYTVTKNPASKGYAHLVADTSASAYKDRLYFIRATGNGNDYKGLWLNYSSDKGMTWSKDIRVDQFLKKGNSKAIVPSIAVNKQGIIGISWVDSHDDPAGKNNDVYFTTSSDGGIAFQRPVKITSVSSNPVTTLNNDVANKFPGGGHYLGIAAKPDGTFQLVWSDSRNGVFQLQTCNVIVLP